MDFRYNGKRTDRIYIKFHLICFVMIAQIYNLKAALYLYISSILYCLEIEFYIMEKEQEWNIL